MSGVRATNRRTIIAGNWKMHKTTPEARVLVMAIAPAVADRRDVEVLVCPPYTALAAACDAAAGTAIGLGAQNVFWKTEGAYTGQISPPMLLDLGVRYVIVGHSETRGRFGVPEPDMEGPLLEYFGETDAGVNRKLHAALDHGLTPICCVGETTSERRADTTDHVVGHQVERALTGVDGHRVPDIVFAYEPVWAIGTGEACAPEEADRVCAVIRSTVALLYGGEAAEAVRVQYGGSCKPGNAGDLLGRPNIDGVLVGGASLVAEDFSAIIRAAPQGSHSGSG